MVYIYLVRSTPGGDISLKMSEYFRAEEHTVRCSGRKLEAVQALLLKGKVIGCRRPFYAAAA